VGFQLAPNIVTLHDPKGRNAVILRSFVDFRNLWCDHVNVVQIRADTVYDENT